VGPASATHSLRTRPHVTSVEFFCVPYRCCARHRGSAGVPCALTTAVRIQCTPLPWVFVCRAAAEHVRRRAGVCHVLAAHAAITSVDFLIVPCGCPASHHGPASAGEPCTDPCVSDVQLNSRVGVVLVSLRLHFFAFLGFVPLNSWTNTHIVPVPRLVSVFQSCNHGVPSRYPNMGVGSVSRAFVCRRRQPAATVFHVWGFWSFEFVEQPVLWAIAGWMESGRSGPVARRRGLWCRVAGSRRRTVQAAWCCVTVTRLPGRLSSGCFPKSVAVAVCLHQCKLTSYQAGWDEHPVLPAPA
jgi:hypothetical protein